MNKVIRMVSALALASAMVVAGCGKNDEVATTETSVTSATTETTATTVDTAATAVDTGATMATDTAATTATTATNADSTGVAECDSYLAALDKYMQCDKVPQAVRDAQKQSAQQMRNSWSTWSSLPEASRKAAQDAAKTSCTTALAALKQAATASNCPIE